MGASRVNTSDFTGGIDRSARQRKGQHEMVNAFISGLKEGSPPLIPASEIPVLESLWIRKGVVLQ